MSVVAKNFELRVKPEMARLSESSTIAGDAGAADCAILPVAIVQAVTAAQAADRGPGRAMAGAIRGGSDARGFGSMPRRTFARQRMIVGAALSTLLLASVPATAADIVFRPINPSFGGSPLNSSHLLAIANAQNNYKPPAVPAPTPVTPPSAAQVQAAQFLSQLQGRLTSQLATQVNEAIFGDNPQESGMVKFGTQTVEFVRGLTEITITLSDSANNSSTKISVPIFTTGN